jgi:hypothetical protein
MLTMRSLAGVAVLSLAATPVLGGAAHAGNRQSPPGPCKTVTAEWVDTLFGVSSATVLHKHVTIEHSGKRTEADTCRIRSTPHELLIRTSLAQGGVGGPFTIYQRPRLGYGGEILVSTTATFPETIALYERDDVYFTDTYNAIVKHKGKRLYRFALHQSKAFANR